MKRFLLMFTLILFIALCGCSESKNGELEQTNIHQANTMSEGGIFKKHLKNSSNLSPVLTFNNKDYDLDSELYISSDELTKDQLGYLRNGIYAKYGYKFKTKMYSDFFSKYEWYKPNKDNVDELLNDIDQKNIKLILDLEKKFSLRSNEQDKIIENNESFTFKINNTQKKLFVYKQSLAGINDGNNPVKITLMIDGSQIEIINNFNDGIDVYLTDFNASDGKVDICIAQSHLDIGRTTSIYTYDGYRIKKYADINHLGNKLLYDQNGNIYFWYSDSEKEHFNYCFDYKTKESYKLKTEIQVQ